MLYGLNLLRHTLIPWVFPSLYLPHQNRIEYNNLRIGLVCVSACLGLWELYWALPQWYRTTLCTTNQHCAPLACIVHHGVQGGPMFMRSRGHPLDLCMSVIPKDFGARGQHSPDCGWGLFQKKWKLKIEMSEMCFPALLQLRKIYILLRITRGGKLLIC